ncbi:MAG: HAMP domain-containing sensor histidine kinase [Leucobacter sp.]
MPRRRGLSVRLRLTLSYAGFLMLAGALLLAVVWVFLLRYVPPNATYSPEGFFPGRMDLIRAFGPAAAWALLALLIFGLLGGWILAGRMLAPLRRITEATRRAARGSLAHRIELEGPRDEFRELADSFDAMLAQLEAHVAEQQRFAANASHELRTPLAVTQTLLDVAERDPAHDEHELLRRLRAVNARAVELTEALLLLSRADQRSFARDRVDLSLLAEQAAETLLPLAERHGVSVEVEGDVAVVEGSGALLLQTVSNLLHNAIVHSLPEGGTGSLGAGAASEGPASGGSANAELMNTEPENAGLANAEPANTGPANTGLMNTVLVRTGVEPAAAPGDPATATLTVENAGEPIPASVLATLAEPFQRGTQRIHGDQAGVGLGLAIVQSIVRAHDGELRLVARPEGGLLAEVRLPAVRDRA